MQNANEIGRQALEAWLAAIHKNNYQSDLDFQHSVAFYLAKDFTRLKSELNNYAEKVINELDAVVVENNLSQNLPRLDAYDSIGNRIDEIVHHPTYTQAGDIIYGSKMLEHMSKAGGLLEGCAFMFLSSQTGEAGHHCPVACSAGIIRVLQRIPDFPNRNFYLQKLLEPSYQNNFTGAQFLTEIQGGSDVGKNATTAHQDEQGRWRIRGEKWFCSNADAELIFITARYNPDIEGTRGLGLFLLLAKLDSGEKNYYLMRRLKDKLGTRSMASAEIDFYDAIAIPMGPVENGFNMVMENVLHISRLLNTICMLGMARRAYYIAKLYTEYREAFGHPVAHYPLVKENLARIKAENTALLAAIFATCKLQDIFDQGQAKDNEQKLLLRLLANLNKTISALWSVDHIHHSIDMLAGNGAIESFSILPRLFRDSIVCENWEGTHNTLHMQILRDIAKYQIDKIYVNFIQKELEKIPSNEPNKKLLVAALQKLQTDFQELKNMSVELQTLQMPKMVAQMFVIYAALNLLLEAVDQAKNVNSQSKLMSLKYFLKLHLTNDPLERNQEYLDLVTAVIKG